MMRPLLLLAERLAQARNGLLDAVVGDSNALPGGIDQFVFGNDLAGPAYQQQENFKMAIRYEHLLTVTVQTAARELELEWTKAIDVWAGVAHAVRRLSPLWSDRGDCVR
jgi:hypothetical protein